MRIHAFPTSSLSWPHWRAATLTASSYPQLMWELHRASRIPVNFQAGGLDAGIIRCLDGPLISVAFRRELTPFHLMSTKFNKVVKRGHMWSVILYVNSLSSLRSVSVADNNLRLCVLLWSGTSQTSAGLRSQPRSVPNRTEWGEHPQTDVDQPGEAWVL